MTLYCFQPTHCLCRNWCMNQCNNWENDPTKISETRFFQYGGQTILTRSVHVSVVFGSTTVGWIYDRNLLRKSKESCKFQMTVIDLFSVYKFYSFKFMRSTCTLNNIVFWLISAVKMWLAMLQLWQQHRKLDIRCWLRLLIVALSGLFY